MTDEVKAAAERLRKNGFNHAECPDGWLECNDALTLAKAYLATAHNGWQPIDTAPHDGTVVLVYGHYLDSHGRSPKFFVEAALYSEHLAGWGNPSVWIAGGDVLPDPSHWMPLPEPPKEPTQ